MTPTEESRFLADILKRIESAPKGASLARWLSIANWLVLVAAFVALFQIGPRVGPIVYVVAVAGIFLGATTSFVLIYEHSVKQWPLLSPFINAVDVKRRIDELNSDKSVERTRGE